MNKKILSKLKMERPEYYDSTENKATIVQKPILEKELNNSYREGLKIGSLLGALGIGLSSLFALVTAQEFNSFLNIPGPTWKAIFILVFIISFVYFLSQIIPLGIKIKKREFGTSIRLSKFFEKEQKIEK